MKLIPVVPVAFNKGFNYGIQKHLINAVLRLFLLFLHPPPHHHPYSHKMKEEGRKYSIRNCREVQCTRLFDVIRFKRYICYHKHEYRRI